MNYSTLKKTVALSLVSLLAVGIANAQTDSSKAAKPMAMSDTTTTAKVFGGRAQYNTWSVGLNVGITSPSVATGGSMDYTTKQLNLGWGASLRNQLGHNFGLQLDLRGGKVGGNDGALLPSSFSTNYFQATISGVANVATIDYIRRKNAVNFFVTAGAGLAFYNPTGVRADGSTFDFKAATNHEVREYVIPLGAGVKFRLTEQWALNLGYTENFIDGDNFDGLKNPNTPDHRDKYSYGYAGLEYTLGSKSKPSLEWVNPVAMMYDELYDAALRQEVEALKGRVGNVENAINDLKKDSDGDGVADQFDKCPNTPAGTVVDGSGCPINFPKIDTSLFMRKPVEGAAKAYSNIQFEFDSSVLRTSSYPTLDLTSADMRSNASMKYELDGFASSEGTAAHNLKLSRDRANSVKTYLVNSGVDSKRLKVKAYGETHPIADNSTEEGRILNRRVEFKKL
ncbi:MAG: OmpA family protein [Bacteroidetes bacterium]|nr:OmpA family protein [Bacteroidota bacterium]